MDKFSSETLQKLDSDLDALLAKDPPIKSNEELIGKYVTKMQAALEKGWPLDALIEVLKNNGVEIQAATLRSYIQRQKKKVAIGADSGAAATASIAVTPAAAAAAKPKRQSRGKGKNNKPDPVASSVASSLETPAADAPQGKPGDFNVDMNDEI